MPFIRLREFLPHEQQLLAREQPLVSEQRPQVRRALPVVTRHPAPERTLPVHHLVVRQRQHEVLAEGIHQAEGDFVVVPAPVHRILVHVLQGIIHPAHVPFEMETQAAGMHRRGHARECG